MPPIPSSLLWKAINQAYLLDEQSKVSALLAEMDARMATGFVADRNHRLQQDAADLVHQIKQWRSHHGGLQAFLNEYDLSSQEGVVLMCLAEALIRIPDADTAERLIRDKLGSADWSAHIGKSDSLLVNAGTWGLMLTGRLVGLDDELSHSPVKNTLALLKRIVIRSGEPVVRLALKEAMGVMARQFVMGRNIEEALSRSLREFSNCRYSFDMLGEGALGQSDADVYFERYKKAIAHLARSGPWSSAFEAPGISVKLSALHPRFEVSQRQRVLHELVPRVMTLAKAAAEAGIGFTVDAEESERLSLTLEIFECLLNAPELSGRSSDGSDDSDGSGAKWEGLGLAVQAYQKRAPEVIDWIVDLAKNNKCRIMLRLVKGAYWDTEIKRAQQQGLAGYPV
ncbi:proline dehydrogenase family protein, partial [Gammaproteobacteria bacterium AH-315-K14]|nr:proline dehydrogenase family protein [Gammaproteobacteria bacterium AH-315-K14]